MPTRMESIRVVAIHVAAGLPDPVCQAHVVPVMAQQNALKHNISDVACLLGMSRIDWEGRQETV